jgi:hypothetical protein
VAGLAGMSLVTGAGLPFPPGNTHTGERRPPAGPPGCCPAPPQAPRPRCPRPARCRCCAAAARAAPLTRPASGRNLQRGGRGRPEVRLKHAALCLAATRGKQRVAAALLQTRLHGRRAARGARAARGTAAKPQRRPTYDSRPKHAVPRGGQPPARGLQPLLSGHGAALGAAQHEVPGGSRGGGKVVEGEGGQRRGLRPPMRRTAPARTGPGSRSRSAAAGGLMGPLHHLTPPHLTPAATCGSTVHPHSHPHTIIPPLPTTHTHTPTTHSPTHSPQPVLQPQVGQPHRAAPPPHSDEPQGQPCRQRVPLAILGHTLQPVQGTWQWGPALAQRLRERPRLHGLRAAGGGENRRATLEGATAWPGPPLARTLWRGPPPSRCSPSSSLDAPPGRRPISSSITSAITLPRAGGSAGAASCGRCGHHASVDRCADVRCRDGTAGGGRPCGIRTAAVVPGGAPFPLLPSPFSQQLLHPRSKHRCDPSSPYLHIHIHAPPQTTCPCPPAFPLPPKQNSHLWQVPWKSRPTPASAAACTSGDMSRSG